MRRLAIAVTACAAVTVVFRVSIVAACQPTAQAGAASTPAHSRQQHKLPNHAKPEPSIPSVSSNPGGMSKRPENAGKPVTPDNMPIKRPDAKTNDRILRDHLPSDAIAR